MKVLVLSNYFSPHEVGGWEQLTADVVAGLVKRGHSACILTSRSSTGFNRSADVWRVLHLESPDHHTYRLVNTLYARRRTAENRAFVTQAITRFEPEIIFINGLWNLSVEVAQEAERLLPDRVVYYMASYWPAEPDAHQAFWQTPPKKRSLRLLKLAVGEWALRWLDQPAKNNLHFARVVCVSDYVRQKLHEQAGIPLANMSVIHNGVESELFVPAQQEIDPQILRLLVAGQVSAHKGIHTILTALAALTRGAARQLSLTIAGAGPDWYRTRLEKLSRDKGIAAHVHWNGRLPRSEMPALMQQHDVLLVPSVWEEPLSRAILEGMSSGMVVIASDTGGSREIITDGEDALLFPAENATALAAQLQRVMDDRELRSRLATKAREKIVAGWTMEQMVGQLEAYFEDIIH